jgi:hypothetical protein
MTAIDSMLATMQAIVTPFDAKIEHWEGRLRKALIAHDAAMQRIGELQSQHRAAATAGDTAAAARCTTELQNAQGAREEARQAESEARAILSNLTKLQYDWRAVRWIAGTGSGK